jgi:hypothetical protein
MAVAKALSTFHQIADGKVVLALAGKLAPDYRKLQCRVTCRTRPDADMMSLDDRGMVSLKNSSRRTHAFVKTLTPADAVS